MKKTVTAIVAIMTLSTLSFASGFRCEGEGYRVKLFNSTGPETRSPSVLILSDMDGTLIRSMGTEILKRQSERHAVYTVLAGNDQVHSVQLTIQYGGEGREVLEAGEAVNATLTITTDEGTDFAELICTRYLKSH